MKAKQWIQTLTFPLVCITLCLIFFNIPIITDYYTMETYSTYLLLEGCFWGMISISMFFCLMGVYFYCQKVQLHFFGRYTSSLFIIILLISLITTYTYLSTWLSANPIWYGDNTFLLSVQFFLFIHLLFTLYPTTKVSFHA